MFELKKLSDVIELVIDNRGRNPKSYKKEGIPVVDNYLITSDGEVSLAYIKRFIDEETYYSFLRKYVQKGDVLMTLVGNGYGKVATTPKERCAIIQNTIGLRCNEYNSNQFLYYLLRNNRESLMSLNRGAAQPSIKVGDVLDLEFEFPSLVEQERIANILGAIDEKIKINRQTNQTLEHIAQAIFKSWFVDFEPTRAKLKAKQEWAKRSPSAKAGGNDEKAAADFVERAAMAAISGKSLDEIEQLELQRRTAQGAASAATFKQLKATAALFPDALVESELGEMPVGWDLEIVGDLFELHRGFDLPKKDRKDGPYPVFAAGGYHGQNETFKMEPPGIITGRSGVIGNVYLSLEKYWPLNTTLYVREFKKCGPYYAYFYLLGCDLKAINSGSAVPSLNRNFVHSLSCFIPSGVLLDEFEKIASTCFKKIKSSESEAEKLSSLRDLLLPNLLSGNIDLQTDFKEAI